MMTYYHGPELTTLLESHGQPPDRPPFRNADTEAFIHSLATSPHEGKVWGSSDMYEMLRCLAQTWQKNPSHVYDLCGSYFWRIMTRLALDQWSGRDIALPLGD